MEMIGVDRIDDIRRLGRDGGEHRLHITGHLSLRAHGKEVPEGARPLREAPDGREVSRFAPARALRRPGRLAAAEG